MNDWYRMVSMQFKRNDKVERQLQKQINKVERALNQSRIELDNVKKSLHQQDLS